MAEQKKKRQSIADMKRELQAMQIASRRRQQGKKATGESVAKELQAAGSGQFSKPSDKSKYVSPSGKQYAGPGYSAGEASKPKPKPKPQPTTAAKPKPKPQPTTAAKPKPKPQPTTTAAKPKPKPQPTKPRPRGTGTPSSPAPNPLKVLKNAVTSVDKALKLTHKKGDTKTVGGVTYRWDGKKWQRLGKNF